LRIERLGRVEDRRFDHAAHAHDKRLDRFKIAIERAGDMLAVADCHGSLTRSCR
jgi:hypothetical protein